MLESQGWLLNARVVWVVLAVYGIVVLVHAAWRSRESGRQDPIRDSGPIL